MNKKIIQILSPSKPVYAVFREGSKENSVLRTEECSVLALVEEENGMRVVIGLTLEEYGFVDPDDSINFEGYAWSREDAEERFGKKSK